MRDMRTFISGPAYARRLVRQARDAGAEILTEAMVTAINPDNSVDVTTPAGLLRVQPGAVIMATGARERPRPARLIPGDRPVRACTPPGTCRTSCTCTTARSANAPSSSAPSWSAGRR